MISKLRHILFVVAFIVTFLHYILAPWSEAPVVPPSDQLEDCEGWLRYHNFTDDLDTNRYNAKTRERQFDPYVSEPAAIYASILTLFIQYKPTDLFTFCMQQQKFSQIKEKYTALKDSYHTCMYWIKKYGFYTSSAEDMWDMVSRRSISEDHYISLWPALFAQYISEDKRRASTTRKEFCREMGQNDLSPLPFVSMKSTLKDCKGWIEFAGYTNDQNHNRRKAQSQNPDYEEIMNIFIKLYSQELRKRNVFKTPKVFCEGYGNIATEMRPYKY